MEAKANVPGVRLHCPGHRYLRLVAGPQRFCALSLSFQKTVDVEKPFSKLVYGTSFFNVVIMVVVVKPT